MSEIPGVGQAMSEILGRGHAEESSSQGDTPRSSGLQGSKRQA
jgi:hypothetical protein